MIPMPSQPKIIEKKDNLAVFEIEGLWPGYGVTIGNSLRRVLLSSLQGAAITQVKIKGVQHEFSTIPGVLEDVVTILLNLKQLRFKLHSEEPQRIRLLVKGEKEALGSSFDLPSQVELMNKESHIATVTDKKTELDIEVLIEKGMGYEPVESRKKSKLEIGTIAVDAIFTPVRKVSYRVESMRVGERTDFDRLLLELETDGTITPEEAISHTSEILVSHFALIGGAFVPPIGAAPGKEEKSIVVKSKKKHEKKKTGKKTK
ncbi:MAG: DNA-directed RNA polymerase subunit alpha [Candidatus Nealsonbacteria bacterium]|nr:DNA-directed RNA polymerase subunit alpha [Candidatus Nealsonbacteria bacterium]